MRREGKALCHGAISVLNAFATGKGGAFGIDLWTRAKVTLQDGSGEVAGTNTSDPNEPRLLMVKALELTLAHFGLADKVSGEVVTWSNIPVGVGLKSSSAAANAIVLATAAALDREIDDDAAIQLAVDASLDAGVSLTGAYDDGYACYHGGGVITDNARRTVEKRFRCPDDTRIIILIPPRKRYTGELSKSSFAPIRNIVDIAYREASDSNHWQAMTLNGLAYSAALGEDAKPAMAALACGALAAGISGKGPSVVAIADSASAPAIREAFGKFEGRVMEAMPNFQRAVLEE